MGGGDNSSFSVFQFFSVWGVFTNKSRNRQARKTMNNELAAPTNNLPIMKITRTAARRKFFNIYWDCEEQPELKQHVSDCYDSLSALWAGSDEKFRRNSQLCSGSSGGHWLHCPVGLIGQVEVILRGVDKATSING